VIDRMKRMVAGTFKMPVPPYGSTMFWDNVYNKMDTAITNTSHEFDDSFEWGNVALQDVLEYKYRPVTIERQYSSTMMEEYASTSTTLDDDTVISTTFGETLGVYPVVNDKSVNNQSEMKKEPILMLGCGNSKMGEEMVYPPSDSFTDDVNTSTSSTEQQQRVYQWRGPLIQVDIAKTALDLVARRTSTSTSTNHYQGEGREFKMQFLHEDATHLSSIRNDTIEATIDKGLLDALFCADEYEQIQDISKSVLRVLKPGGIFVVFSFSRPEFLLPKLLPLQPRHYSSNKASWQDLQIRQLDTVLLYRFQKSLSSSSTGFQEPKRSSRKKQ